MIDIKMFEANIRQSADAYGLQRSDPRQSGYLPPEDATAARILYAIADAVRMSTDDTEHA